MRSISLSPRPPNNLGDELFKQWVSACFDEIQNASIEEISLIASDFTITGYTETRTLDASTATATDVANVLCTLILDLQRHGQHRTV